MESKTVIVHSPQIIEKESGVSVHYPIESEGWPRELWFDISGLAIDGIDNTLNTALLALIIPAMSQGRDIVLKGDISCRLLLSCSHEVQSILSQMLGLEVVKIETALGYKPVKKPNLGVPATGFSGGVDSYAILNDYYFSTEIPYEDRVSLLFFNNVGANGTTDETMLYHRRRDQAEVAAAEIGLPLVIINSNMDDFYIVNPELFFAKTHTLRNSSVAHLVSNAVSVYRYASAFPFSDCKVQGSSTIGHSDPILLPFLGSEWLDIQANGSQYSRAEKIALIANNPVVQKNLHVCVDHNSEGNCSKCQKCMRTMLTLDLMGKLSLFHDAFDHKSYFIRKRGYLIRALSRKGSFSCDIQELYKKSGGRLNIREKVKVTSHRIKCGMKEIVKTVKGESPEK